MVYQANFSLSFNLEIYKVYEITIDWLNRKGATINKSDKPTYIEAIHGKGGFFLLDDYDIRHKKKIRIDISSNKEGNRSITVRIVLVNYKNQEWEKLQRTWWKKLFKDLFSKISNEEGKHKYKNKQENLKRLKRLFEISYKIKIDDMAILLDVKRKKLLEILIDLSESFNCKMNGDFIILDKEEIVQFIEKLKEKTIL